MILCHLFDTLLKIYFILGWTSLMIASSYEFLPSIIDYPPPDYEFQPPDPRIMETLLEYGADINAKNYEGW